MNNFKEIAEKCLKGELSGIFILRNGRKVHSSLLSRFDNEDLPYKLDRFFYHSNGSYIYSNVSNIDIINFIPNMEERNVKLTLNKAKEWYEKGGELKEVALQAYTEEELKDSKPRSWEEYSAQMRGKVSFFINDISNIKDAYYTNSQYDRNLLPTKELAEAFLAYMQLISLRQAWIGDWKAQPGAPTIVRSWDDRIIVWKDYEECLRLPLSFPTQEMAIDFINCFKDLLEIAKPLI